MDKVNLRMKLFSRLILGCVALLFLGAGAVEADTAQLLYFDLTGPADMSATFELWSKPVPTASDPACGFTVTPIDLQIDGKASSDFIAFYNNACGGALAAFSDSDDFDFSLYGD